MVAGGVCPGRSFAMHPGGAVIHDLLPGDVVADEVHETAGRAGGDLLKGFEDKCVDQQMVNCGEIRTERHVVQVSVGLRCAERSINEFLILAGQGQPPALEELLQRVELTHRQIVSKAARAAV